MTPRFLAWLACVGYGVVAGLLVYGGWKVLVYLWEQDGSPPLWVPHWPEEPPEEGAEDWPRAKFATVLLWVVLGFLLGFMAKPIPPPRQDVATDPTCERWKAEAAFLDKVQAESHLTMLQRAQAAKAHSEEPSRKKGGVE